MPVPELPFLRNVLGDPWIEAEVFTEKPTHLLGRWQKEKPENPWVVTHAEALVKAILSSKSINFNPEILDATERCAAIGCSCLFTLPAEFGLLRDHKH